jgi:hypothetical protein
MRILRGQSNLEVSSKGFALFVVGLVLATFIGGAVRTVLSSEQVHQRIVTELKNRFPKHEFQIGATEVLLSRGIWPGLGLRVRGLTFRQDVCGKLSFLLTIPEAILPLDILSLRHGQIRLNDVTINGGGIHLDYHDCPPKPPTPEAEADAAGGPPAAVHKSIQPPRLNWQDAAQVLDGIELKGFVVTYEKNPTWKLTFNRAYVALRSELNGHAQVDVEKSLPFGALTHPVEFDLHGDKNTLQWNFNADFKEGNIRLNGSLDVNSEAAMTSVTVRQVPIKDFMSEMFQMGFVDHDLKLKATWLSCGLHWDGRLQAYDATPVKLSDCRVEGGYGRAELGQAEFWLSGPEYFKTAARLKISQLEMQPLVEALNRQVLPAVLSRLGVWSGELEFKSGATWNLDGNLQSAEIVFSNQSTYGKQTLDSVHTVVHRAGGRVQAKIDEVRVREGEFAGSVDFDLADNWRDGVFHAQIEKLVFSPVIQKIMVGGIIGALKAEGQGALADGELSKWNGTFSIPELRGEGWRAEALEVRSRFEKGAFHLEGTVKNATANTSWRIYPQLRTINAEIPDQVTWKDLAAKVEIGKTGGTMHSASGVEAQSGRPWRAKGSWVRDGEFVGALTVGLAKKQQTFALHGSKGSLSVENEPGVSR